MTKGKKQASNKTIAKPSFYEFGGYLARETGVGPVKRYFMTIGSSKKRLFFSAFCFGF
ncbi:hypothetical protein [Pelobium manganitolerans]|uniref:hypothetical protein n=1 Tax=Pelobium manganitolerans TaxID=1842495 RepID=UPI003FA38F9F